MTLSAELRSWANGDGRNGPRMVLAADEIDDLAKANALLHELVSNRDADIVRLRTALSWVDEVYPGKNRESDGAIVHMTWEQWNGLRRELGLREQPIPSRASQTVRIVKARTHEQLLGGKDA